LLSEQVFVLSLVKRQPVVPLAPGADGLQASSVQAFESSQFAFVHGQGSPGSDLENRGSGQTSLHPTCQAALTLHLRVFAEIVETDGWLELHPGTG